MNASDFVSNIGVGNIVQVVWLGPLFDPDLIVKPGESTLGPSKVFTCGFVAFHNKDFVSIGIDSMFEGTNTEPSFRTVLTIPVSSIINGEIYGKLSK